MQFSGSALEVSFNVVLLGDLPVEDLRIFVIGEVKEHDQAATDLELLRRVSWWLCWYMYTIQHEL
jgi:hypothetical protein